MERRKQQLKDFFDRYAADFNQALRSEAAGVEATAAAFSASFIAADPSGVRCGSNNEEFRNVMAQRYGFYRSIGVTSMEIISLETTLLDEFHEMTKLRWSCNYTRKDASEGRIAFENIYLTQTRENAPAIFAYITGDEQAALRENGLI